MEPINVAPRWTLRSLINVLTTMADEWDADDWLVSVAGPDGEVPMKDGVWCDTDAKTVTVG